jgi:hypothetical protein
MALTIFLLLLGAHVFGDMILASYKLAVLKRSPQPFNQVVAIACHSGIHAFLAAILLMMFQGVWLICGILVFSLHFVIDFTRCRVEMRLFGPGRIFVKRSEFIAWISGRSENPDKMNLQNLSPWFLINFLDQGAHLASLYGISMALQWLSYY